MNKNTSLENIEYHEGYNLETIHCPLCGGKDFIRLVVEQGIPIVRCKGCELVFANPRPNMQGLLKFYENYFPPESASLWQEQMSEIFMIEGYERIYELQEAGVIALPSSPRVLDVGCGMGFFIHLMQKKGWVVKGIEPSPEAVRHAREVLKLDVVEGVIESVNLEQEQRYDVITLWYVMEHVPNPEVILKCVNHLLKPNGLLVIRVPNQNAPIDVLLSRLGLSAFSLINPPRHLFDYSPKTLTRFLEKFHFKVIKIQNGIPRKTGTPPELLRRHLWYWFFEVVYHLSRGAIIRGSSMTLYAQKKD